VWPRPNVGNDGVLILRPRRSRSQRAGDGVLDSAETSNAAGHQSGAESDGSKLEGKCWQHTQHAREGRCEADERNSGRTSMMKPAARSTTGRCHHEGGLDRNQRQHRQHRGSHDQRRARPEDCPLRSSSNRILATSQPRNLTTFTPRALLGRKWIAPRCDGVLEAPSLGPDSRVPNPVGSATVCTVDVLEAHAAGSSQPAGQKSSLDDHQQPCRPTGAAPAATCLSVIAFPPSCSFTLPTSLWPRRPMLARTAIAHDPRA